MHCIRNSSLLKFTPVLIGIGIFAAGCGDQTRRPAAIDKARIQLKEQWKSRVERRRNLFLLLPDDFGFHREQVIVLKDLLEKASPKIAEAELNAISATPPSTLPEDRWDLEKSYGEDFIEAFALWTIQHRDARRLKLLLCSNCPIYLTHSPLEYSLARDWPASVAYLFDSYTASQSRQSKSNIVKCLSRAFPSLRAKGSSDDCFVGQARSWWEGHQSKVTPNHEYPYLMQQPPYPRPKSQDLFICKEE